MTGVAVPSFGLLFVLGLRHGLDPDHVAVIDNIVFRLVDVRPRLATWTESLFALGHSLAVAAVALGVATLTGRIALPAWTGTLVDLLVVALLFVVGTVNLAALLRRAGYVPMGWRARMLPVSLRTSTHPLAILAIGMIFGLVFDTATQAAAWGAVATAKGGIVVAAGIAASFALGMTLADTCDSQLVGRLLLSSPRADSLVRRYRRAVGWLVVALSYGMGLFAVFDLVGTPLLIDEWTLTALGTGCAVLVAALLTRAWLMSRQSCEAGAASRPCERRRQNDGEPQLVRGRKSGELERRP